MKGNALEKYEDRVRKEKSEDKKLNRYSRYCDFIYYKSTRSPELTLAMRVLKPEKPSYIKAGTHGWHMTIPDFKEYDAPQSDYLQIDVDMRGRSFSDGKPDCNGWELFDVIDAIEYVKVHYSDFILDPEVVFFEAGSGGGGNAYAIAGKFPDYFAHIVAQCGISDYAMWYENDAIGEFRDEMDVWIGDFKNKEAYASRSGLTSVQNLTSPIAMVHGETDVRVPSEHARRFAAEANKLGKGDLVTYMELPGVGTRDHWGNITPEGMQALLDFCEDERRKHMKPVHIPRSGKMTVCGYIFTKEFSVVLDSIDRVATLNYDLDTDFFQMEGLSESEYTLTRK